MDREKIRRWLPLALSLPLAAMAGGAVFAASYLPELYEECYGYLNYKDEKDYLETFATALLITQGLLYAGAAVAGLAGLVGLIPKRLPLKVLRIGYFATYAFVLVYVYMAQELTTHPAKIDPLSGQVNPPAFVTFMLWWEHVDLALLAAAIVGILHVLSTTGLAIGAYTGAAPAEPAIGDRILENIRTHGRDPHYRKSLIGSFLTHFCVIILIPWLLRLYGCVEPYRVPKGSGNPVVAMVKMVKPQKRKKKIKRFILNPNSAIIFRVATLEDSTLLKEVQEATELTYKATANAMAGRMGKGGGKTGGWPDGMENHRVRLIRLEYHGSHDWNDGMDARSSADMNFLRRFHELTGFRIARNSESHPIHYLKKYPKGYHPPFVYMTGTGGITVSGSDIRILREYLLGGGMLFADCGSMRWDRSFREFARRLFPEYNLLEIADDDPIFQMPYQFPHGAPPLWHHGGNRALGIRHKGRLVVFYHPGDINDAWKTGHSGMDPDLAEGAFDMGVNIIYYAFTNYLELTRKYRK